MRDRNLIIMVLFCRFTLRHQNSSHNYKDFTKSQPDTFSTSKSIQRPRTASRTLLQTFSTGYVYLNTSPHTPHKPSVLIKPQNAVRNKLPNNLP